MVGYYYSIGIGYINLVDKCLDKINFFFLLTVFFRLLTVDGKDSRMTLKDNESEVKT